MESIKKEAQIWFSLIVILLIWGGILKLTGTPLSFDNWKALEKLPEVVTVFVLARDLCVHEMALALPGIHVQGMAGAIPRLGRNVGGRN